MASKLDSKRDYVWLIDPRGDDVANEMLGKSLGDENAYTEQLCQDGRKRDMYRCPDHEFVANFERAAERKKLRYQVYVRVGRNSPARPWGFVHPKKKSEPATAHAPANA